MGTSCVWATVQRRLKTVPEPTVAYFLNIHNSCWEASSFQTPCFRRRASDLLVQVEEHAKGSQLGQTLGRPQQEELRTAGDTVKEWRATKWEEGRSSWAGIYKNVICGCLQGDTRSHMICFLQIPTWQNLIRIPLNYLQFQYPLYWLLSCSSQLLQA